MIRLWNIETGQMIKEFKFDLVCMAVKEEYLVLKFTEDDKIIVWDLQSNKLINTLLDYNVSYICINDNKIISVVDDATIRIRNLNKKIKGIYRNRIMFCQYISIQKE